MDVQTPLWFLLVLSIAPAIVTGVSVYYANKQSSDARSRDLKVQLEYEVGLRTREMGKEFRMELVHNLNDLIIPYLAAYVKWAHQGPGEVELPPGYDFEQSMLRAFLTHDADISSALDKIYDFLDKYEEAIEHPLQDADEQRKRIISLGGELGHLFGELGRAEEKYVSQL